MELYELVNAHLVIGLFKKHFRSQASNMLLDILMDLGVHGQKIIIIATQNSLFSIIMVVFI